MILINVPQDGNCLFRCLYIYLNRIQRTYERFKNGKIRKRTINKKESDDSNELRQDIIDYVENNKDKYDSIMYNDNEDYETIEERIELMRMPTEYGGIIELDAAAYLNNICIEVYVECETRFNKIATINERARKICRMLLETDHYNLILKM